MAKLVSFFIAIVVFLVLPSPAQAQTWQDCMVNISEGGQTHSVVTISCVEVIAKSILNIMLYVIGLGAFIMIVVAAITLLASGGDPKKVEQGTKTITYAIGGLLGVFLIWFFLNLTSIITGINSILNFTITI